MGAYARIQYRRRRNIRFLHAEFPCLMIRKYTR